MSAVFFNGSWELWSRAVIAVAVLAYAGKHLNALLAQLTRELRR